MQSGIRVVLGEDHALVREGTRHMLAQYPDLAIVGEAGDGQEVLGLIAELRPDVAILDVRMPGLNAIEITRKVAEVSPNTRTLILTAYDDDDFVLAAMEAGATGYLLKTVRATELVEAVRAVNRGETVLHPDIGRKIALMWARKRPRTEPEWVEPLTPRELEVLQCAARGMRNKDISRNLGVSVRTVEGHLSTILAKLGVPSRTAAVVYAAAHRLVSLGDEETTP